LSSKEYSSELTPDPVMNRLLLVAALLTTTLGIVTIAHLPTGDLLRVAGVLAWCCVAGYEIVDISSSHKRYSRLRVFADGDVKLRTRDGQWQTAALHRGCIVLSTLAWLNLRLADGGRYRALLRGDALESEQWRRLQVIWRHLGTAGGSC
jgi:hypothetical protein